MALIDQLEALAEAHYRGDDEMFDAVLARLAKLAADNGRTQDAERIAALVRDPQRLAEGCSSVPVGSFFTCSLPNIPFDHLVVSREVRTKLERLLEEYRQRAELSRIGLSNRRCILLEGVPGSGKTMTASVIASELGRPLFSARSLDLLHKCQNKTSEELQQLLVSIGSQPGIYLIEEFDEVASRGSELEDVERLRVILGSFMRFLEESSPDSIIIAVTHDSSLLDSNLLRCFDDVLTYDLPTTDEALRIIRQTVGPDVDCENMAILAEKASLLCQADIVRVCNEAVKTKLLTGTPLSMEELSRLFDERLDVYVDHRVVS